MIQLKRAEIYHIVPLRCSLRRHFIALSLRETNLVSYLLSSRRARLRYCRIPIMNHKTLRSWRLYEKVWSCWVQCLRVMMIAYSGPCRSMSNTSNMISSNCCSLIHRIIRRRMVNHFGRYRNALPLHWHSIWMRTLVYNLSPHWPTSEPTCLDCRRRRIGEVRRWERRSHWRQVVSPRSHGFPARTRNGRSTLKCLIRRDLKPKWRSPRRNLRLMWVKRRAFWKKWMHSGSWITGTSRLRSSKKIATKMAILISFMHLVTSGRVITI